MGFESASKSGNSGTRVYWKSTMFKRMEGSWRLGVKDARPQLIEFRTGTDCWRRFIDQSNYQGKDYGGTG